MIRVLIADDHPLVRAGLRQVLLAHPDFSISGEVDRADEVEPAVRRTRPDVLLLDVSMPGPEFLDVLRTVSEAFPDLRTLVVSAHPERAYARRALEAGAAGYLTKDRSADELVGAVRKVFQGGRYVSESFAQQLAAELQSGLTGEPHEALTDREYQVMRLLAAGRTVGDVARQLMLSVKTVSTHRARILRKMGMRSNAELTYYAISKGLID